MNFKYPPIKLLAALLALASTPALAMNLSNVPPKFPIPWGNSAGGTFIRPIPTPSQIGIQNCAASLTDGFPPLTFQPVSGGGCAPFGSDFNGILKQLSQWSQWAGAGAIPAWDSAFSASIGGYPRGALVATLSFPGCYWSSTVDGNTTNPDSGGVGWTGFCPGGGVGTGPSTGSPNAQVITTTPFALAIGMRIVFIPGFQNSTSTTIVVNGAAPNTILRRTPFGDSNLTGGELNPSQIVELAWNGSNWELMSSATDASTSAPDQTLGGGANVISAQLPAGNITVDCGLRPLQWIPNTAPFAINAPTNDGSCMVQIENGAGAGSVTFSGFTAGANTGDPLTTINGNKFVVAIWRIHSVSSYLVKALQ